MHSVQNLMRKQGCNQRIVWCFSSIGIQNIISVTIYGNPHFSHLFFSPHPCVVSSLFIFFCRQIIPCYERDFLNAAPPTLCAFKQRRDAHMLSNSIKNQKRELQLSLRLSPECEFPSWDREFCSLSDRKFC